MPGFLFPSLERFSSQMFCICFLPRAFSSADPPSAVERPTASKSSGRRGLLRRTGYTDFAEAFGYPVGRHLRHLRILALPCPFLFSFEGKDSALCCHPDPADGGPERRGE